MPEIIDKHAVRHLFYRLSEAAGYVTTDATSPHAQMLMSVLHQIFDKVGDTECNIYVGDKLWRYAIKEMWTPPDADPALQTLRFDSNGVFLD